METIYLLWGLAKRSNTGAGQVAAAQHGSSNLQSAAAVFCRWKVQRDTFPPA